MIYLPANYRYVCLAFFIVPPQTILSSNIVRLKSHCDLWTYTTCLVKAEKIQHATEAKTKKIECSLLQCLTCADPEVGQGVRTPPPPP